MSEPFLHLDEGKRELALTTAADILGRPESFLEKDIWTVWLLRALFNAPFGRHLVFKGGTSLSKTYSLNRFSEDIDVTYDIRAIAPDLVGDTQDAIPPTRSQASKWTKAVRERLPRWIDNTVVPWITGRLQAENLPATVIRDNDTALVRYDPVVSMDTDYIRPQVLLEFGARATGEPATMHEITCDAASALDGVTFPSVTLRVMRVERTFWEKVTATHVYCLRSRFRNPGRDSRHWHDLVHLDDAGFATAALADRELANAVAAHKERFFVEKDTDGAFIDYRAAVNGGLCMVPTGEPLAALREDYREMAGSGMIFDEPLSFDALMARCADLEKRANA